MRALELFRKWNANPLFLPGAVLVALLGLAHAVMPIAADDAINIPHVYSVTLREWVHHQFSGWSSRFIIDTISWPLYHVFDVWRVLNVLVFLVLFIFLTKLLALNNSRLTAWMGMFTVLALPFGRDAWAGFLATSITYYWPLAAGVVVAYGVKKVLTGHRLHVWEVLGYLAALLMAIDQEQSNVFVLGMLLLTALYCLVVRRQRPPVLLVTFAVLAAARMVLALLAPGPAVRRGVEIARFFPDFGTRSVTERLQMGFSPTLGYLFGRPERIMLALTILVLCTILVTQRHWFYRLLGAVPLAAVIVTGWAEILRDITGIDTGRLMFFGGIVERRNMIDLRTYDNLFNYVPILFFGVVWVCLIIAVYLIHENRPDVGWFSAGVLVAGFVSRFVVGFSPTGFDSGARTFTYAYLALLMVLFLAAQRLIELRPKRTVYWAGTLGVLALGSTWTLAVVITSGW